MESPRLKTAANRKGVKVLPHVIAEALRFSFFDAAGLGLEVSRH